MEVGAGGDYARASGRCAQACESASRNESALAWCDVRNRDITLGFHESCHQLDLERFLDDHSLPDPPEMRIGMSRRAFTDAVEQFRRKLDGFRTDMDQSSAKSTDEVGHAKSTWRKTRKCFVHQLP